MLLHKEIEMPKTSMYSQLPHFRLALVIDHHHHHLIHFHYHRNRQCHLAIQDKMESRCSKPEIPRHLLDYRNQAHVRFQKYRRFNEYGYER
jgi:hypothetical protein